MSSLMVAWNSDELPSGKRRVGSSLGAAAGTGWPRTDWDMSTLRVEMLSASSVALTWWAPEPESERSRAEGLGLAKAWAPAWSAAGLDPSELRSRLKSPWDFARSSRAAVGASRGAGAGAGFAAASRGAWSTLPPGTRSTETSPLA